MDKEATVPRTLSRQLGREVLHERFWVWSLGGLTQLGESNFSYFSFY